MPGATKWAAAAVMVFATGASAAIIEAESNNTPATANPLGNTPGQFYTDVGVASLAAGGLDVDFFSVTLAVGDFFTANTAPITVPFTVPDTIMALIGPGGSVLITDDDDGQGTGSSFTWQAAVAGTYSLAISGYGDFDTVADDAVQPDAGTIDGIDPIGPSAHDEVGQYILTVSVVPVPEPTMLGGLAVAGLLALRRRR